MPNYLNKNGETYTEQELISYARLEGLTLQEYISNKTFEKVDPSIFDDSETELREILDAVDTKKIKYCEHNVTGKRYRINQRMKIMRHDFDVGIEQKLN